MIFKPGETTSMQFPCEIQKRLPGGSMAELYLARITNTKHQVVVKGVGQEGSLILRDALRKEAEIMRGLWQESIPEFYGYFEERKRNYYIMSYHSGSNLEDYLSWQRKLSEKQVHRIALRICKTLDYLHKKGVVYGDLKPSNILISGDEVILLDYGAACMAEDRAENLLFRGTIGYAAPECWYGGGQLTYAVDIFALGALIYRMLEGQEPKNHFGKLVLSDRQKKNRWQSVLDKCCALDVCHRYQSVTQVYEILSKMNF